ncbi:MAG: cytidine/deoxycytidylate deaminase family protein [Candidatus Aenigmatarchaeota archaeon]
MERPSWDEYFLSIAKEVSKRGTCPRLNVGSIIVRDKRIISTGYSGAPKGLPHCHDVGCLMVKSTDHTGKIKEHCWRTAHAEQNAIVQAAMHGASTEGATLYTTDEPCLICAKMIINAGIKRVVCARPYHDAELSRQFLKEAGIELVFLNPDKEKD